MSFREHLRGIPLEDLLERARRGDRCEVERALRAEQLDLFDFAALLSPQAEHCLEEMARRAHATTVRRFGKTVQLYAPLYVSNECVETCTYCSFSRENPIPRRTLSLEEALAEARMLTERGFRHILLVSGEHPRHVPPEFIARLLQALRGEVPSLSVEVQPQRTDIYRLWKEAGADGLVVYQETYDRRVYASVHLAGKKRDFDWRLETPERGAEGGMKRLGIGALLGLADWRLEAVHLAAHTAYLMRRYWRTFVTVSFPRLRPAAFATEAPRPVGDRELAQMICAFRILFPDVGIVLSTRERAELRDGLVALGVTQMSAGSRTEPGGYSAPERSGAQFGVEDRRSPREVACALRQKGYDPVWKDWEVVLHG